MATQKKFGTFSGVLTPSLLTILGVIMYMRLGSVVGNSSGIIQVVLIIVFAHLISITTGLSVSSISTDKKIEKGGIYYMLTRSLGLPIGGAIGLTIFIATAFSISLYLIGFAESLIPVLDESFGIGEISINKLRIFGTIALSFVMIIAYISTSFALKIQYVILGLIILSLGSIFFGSSDGLKVGTDIIEAPSFSVLFGIFFPAVTGFTAGVAMSGDLKNPRLSIPWGTMIAISIGLVVYIVLAVFIYYNIDAEILKTNNNVLIEFGAISILVLAGVWGATLSSALGGILGGPRILQAMSLDNITPKTFAKGYGLNNEPRNALILTFIIAELGILIGELNVIAELVAMFYMAAYLFINISCFLEQWSSPDFRPKFKIPIWISLIGAIATFLLMIQLNLAATLFAVLIMLVIWFWLSKKDLVLGTGDVWFGVWTSIVKTGLKNLQKKAVHRRNWQPNILLFSGGTNNRPHLIEFGKSISGRGGMVSNFDLIEQQDSNALFPKPNQIVKDDQIKDDSIFHRRLYCQNIFKGIETIANTYGFSGIDPNTVLMGWARNTKDPIYFGQMTQKLKELDYNILYLDYDQRRGFGNYAEISIWWSGTNKENELSLQIVKFLRSSIKWKNADLIIFYVNEFNSPSESVISEIEMILDKKRMRAEVKIINNIIEKKNIYQLIKSRSYSSDLILMNLPTLIKGKEKLFIEDSNDLFNDVGSALYIEASSNFKLSNVKSSMDTKEKEPAISNVNSNHFKPELIKTYDEKFDADNSIWQDELIKINEHLSVNLKSNLSPLLNFYKKAFNSNKLKEELVNNLYNTQELYDISEELENSLNNSIEDYFSEINQFIKNIPLSYLFNYHLVFLQGKVFNHLPKSGILNRRVKQLQKNESTIKEKINLVRLLDFQLKNNFTNNFHLILKIFGEIHLVLYHQYKLFLEQDDDSFLNKSIDELIDESLNKISFELNQLVTKLLNGVIIDIGLNKVNRLIEEREEEFNPKEYRKRLEPIEDFAFNFSKNTIIFHNHKVMSCSALLIKQKSIEQLDQFENLIFNEVFDKYSVYINEIDKKSSAKKTGKLDEIVTVLEGHLINTNREIDQFDLSGYMDIEIEQFPQELEVYSSESLNEFNFKQAGIYEKTYYVQATLKSIYYQSINSRIQQLVNYNKDWVRKEVEELISAYKLLIFTSDNQNDSGLIDEVRAKLKHKIKEFNSNLNVFKDRFHVEVHEIRNYCNKLSDEQFLLDNNSKRVVEGSKDGNGDFYSKINKVQNYLSENFIRLIESINPEKNISVQYSQSDKILELRKFMKSCSLKPSIFDNISPLYLQLFNYKIQPNSFFSSFVSNQLISIKKVIETPASKNQNVIIISGDPQSGKSYIVDQITASYKNKNCYIVEPPIDIKIQPIEKTIKSLLHQINSSSNKVVDIGKLSKGSIVFIPDFELWWRKTKDGYYAINLWLEFFKKYEDKIIFIVEVNELLKNHLVENTDLDKHVIKYLSTTLFSGKQFQEISDEKSKMSDQIIYPAINKVNYKRINRAVFGNIGWFNSYWLSSLEINNSQCEINPDYDLSFPSFLSDLEMTVLLQFYWHKRINVDNISSYFYYVELNKINEILSFFKAEKLLISVGGSMELNYHITPYLKRYFIENNYISK